MKKNLKAIAKFLCFGAVAMSILSACTVDPDSPGLEYTPDMYRSPAIEPYVDYAEFRGKEHPELKTKQSALRPPHRTIPYYGTDKNKVLMMLPYKRLASSAMNVSHGLYEKDGWRLSDSLDVEYLKSAKDKNPIALNAENQDAIFARGKKIYAQMCAHCHGEKGDGEGPMVKSGAYAGVPDYKNLTNLGDGQVFYSIYYGKGAMGAHAMMLDKEEIWLLVHYVNKFRFDDYGKSGDDTVDIVDENEENLENAEALLDVVE
ncbi:MAG: cytochrome c [Crocinitomicaceae bacterium]|nr:cytochrome c [Crocinitomicaceae bacterium]